MSKQETPKQKNWFARHKIWTVVIVLFVLALLGSAVNQGKNTDTTTPAASSNTTPQAEAKWDVEAVYAKINNGMTKAQVEEVTGKKSESCTESQSEYIGKSEICSYGNAFIDKATITVTYSQDVVSSKSKHSY